MTPGPARSAASAAFAAPQAPRRERRGDQLYGQILEQIVTGALGEGARLPTEKELCRRYEVSRPVVREALMRLQADGLVAPRHGVGSFVARRPPPALIQLAAPADVSGILDCHEARAALECEAAALAARRRGEPHLDAMAAALRALQAAAAQRRPAPQADVAFHRAIAVAAENATILGLLESLHGSTARWLHIVLNITASHASADRAQRVYDEHVRVFEAIEEGDAERARLMMRYHLDQARRRLMDHHRDG
jgi:DNA-binding FadR family transcriptional regulator